VPKIEGGGQLTNQNLEDLSPLADARRGTGPKGDAIPIDNKGGKDFIYYPANKKEETGYQREGFVHVKGYDPKNGREVEGYLYAGKGPQQKAAAENKFYSYYNKESHLEPKFLEGPAFKRGTPSGELNQLAKSGGKAPYETLPLKDGSKIAFVPDKPGNEKIYTKARGWEHVTGEKDGKPLKGYVQSDQGENFAKNYSNLPIAEYELAYGRIGKEGSHKPIPLKDGTIINLHSEANAELYKTTNLAVEVSGIDKNGKTVEGWVDKKNVKSFYETYQRPSAVVAGKTKETDKGKI
jgi:hypothetical protein